VFARGFQHREGSVDIGAKIGFRLLDRWDDVGAGREVKNAFYALAGGVDCAVIGDIGLDDLKVRVAVVLGQVGAAADDETVIDPDATALFQKAIDKMAANKTAAARD
jgi:hypothetical protein